MACNTPEAFDREWLVTNGIGGYAMGTIGGVRNRRYHAALVAAVGGPSQRKLMLGDISVCATYCAKETPLTAARWPGGLVNPQGHLFLQRFHIEQGIPCWRWAVSDALIERRVFMVHGENTLCQHWTLVQGSSPVRLQMKLLVDCRSHHALGDPASLPPTLTQVDHGVSFTWSPSQNATSEPLSLHVQCERSISSPAHEWWSNYELTTDNQRGYAGADSLWHGATMELVLAPGECALLMASTTPQTLGGANAALAKERERHVALISAAKIESDRPALSQLAHAADQFVVSRLGRDGKTSGTSVIAGYPWFGEWARDAMISLPGLLLSTGRVGEARSLLSGWAEWLDGGLLPNRFPDTATDPVEFNAADAPLLMIRAARLTYEAKPDRAWLSSIIGSLESIVDAYMSGTKHGIAVDPSDGLVRAAAAGWQLTWMDAKVDGFVVTPRAGKPVEINAFWFEALQAMEFLASALGKPTEKYANAKKRVRTSFSRFWNEHHSCCYDVIDTEQGNDASVRPNQLFASALGDSLLPAGQRHAICNLAMANLWTPQGMRTLTPDDRAYQGCYSGDGRSRDLAYHQGTVWPWLFLPLAKTHFGVHHSARAVADFLFPFLNHMREGGLGTLSEVFSGDPPHTPGGCPAQAWSVAATLELVGWIAEQDAQPTSAQMP